MKFKHLLTGCLLAGLAWAPARTWTSSDGERTFEGELRAYDEATGEVTVLLNGRQIAFQQDKLSEADQTYLSEWKAKKDAPAAASLEDQKIGKKLTDKVLSRLNGDSFESVSMEKAPEYYLLYFSASW